MPSKIVIFTTDNEARVIAELQNVSVLFVNSDDNTMKTEKIAKVDRETLDQLYREHASSH